MWVFKHSSLTITLLTDYWASYVVINLDPFASRVRVVAYDAVRNRHFISGRDRRSQL